MGWLFAKGFGNRDNSSWPGDSFERLPAWVLNGDTFPDARRGGGTGRKVDVGLGLDSFLDENRHPHERIRRPDFCLDLLFQSGLFLHPLLHLGHLPLDLALQGFAPEHGTQGH